MLEVNAERLLEDLDTLNGIGLSASGRGWTRLAYSDADAEARRWLQQRMQEAGLVVEVDGIGNIYATPAGMDGGPVVLSGSHIDTVIEGGPYDGALGTLMALEAARSIQEAGVQTRYPVGVVCFACEESARFGSGCIGSRVATGALNVEDLKDMEDDRGVSVAQAARTAGLDPVESPVRRLTSDNVKSFVEVHVEQGRDLQEAGVPLGIVTAIASPWRWWLSVAGTQGHSGGTDMHGRQDALAGAAEVVLAVEQVGRRRRDRVIRTTVGVIRAMPGLFNTISGRTDLGLDIRGIDPDEVRDASREIFDVAADVCRDRNLTVHERLFWEGSPYEIPPAVVASADQAAERRGVDARRMISWGGHDAMYVGRVSPAAMFFTRNPTGMSHHAAEAAEPRDIEAVANVLLEMLLELAVTDLRQEALG